MKTEINVTKASLPPIEEYIEMIKPIWENAWLTNMGQMHNKLLELLKEYFKINNLSLFVNGHLALEMVIQAMELEGEVITTPFTFVSTTHAIVRNGLKPVFCDINPQDYTMDTTKIESLITEKTSAIVPVHVYGNICNVEEIERIAKKYNLKVIYDAAHAFGVKYKGKSILEYGDASMLSFHATKVFNSIEGGAVAFKDPLLEESLYTLKNFGIKSPEIVNGIGANAKMNEFQAAMGICNLKYVDENIQKRKILVERYQKNFEGISGITLLQSQKDVESNFSYFPICFENIGSDRNRNFIHDKLSDYGIHVRKYFYPLISDMDCYRNQYDSMSTPIAKRVAESVLTLPLYPELKIEEVDYICEIIKKIYI